MAIFKKPRVSAKLSKLNRRKPAAKGREDFGKPGLPIDTTRPFYFGFMVTAGALVGISK